MNSKNLTKSVGFTDAQIQAAVDAHVKQCREAPLHEHPDCVRLAVQWLDAQERAAGATKTPRPLKHLIEQWGERYVSSDDVAAATRLLGIKGRYPWFAIDCKRLVLPNPARLTGIGQAGLHPNYRPRDPMAGYARRESL